MVPLYIVHCYNRLDLLLVLVRVLEVSTPGHQGILGVLGEDVVRKWNVSLGFEDKVRIAAL